MEKVRMVHDETGAEYEAPALAVPHLRQSGWVPVDERPQAAAPAPSPAPTKAADPQKTTSGAARPARDGSAD